jgi:hypothetical protein
VGDTSLGLVGYLRPNPRMGERRRVYPVASHRRPYPIGCGPDSGAETKVVPPLLEVGYFLIQCHLIGPEAKLAAQTRREAKFSGSRLHPQTSTVTTSS